MTQTRKRPAAKPTATIIPFPIELTRLPKETAQWGRVIPVKKGSIELFGGRSGMVLVDACVPAAIAARMLAAANV